MNLKEILYDLTSANGVAGEENVASLKAKNYLSNYFDDVKIDDFYNVFATKKGSGEGPHILLDAHIDEIGMIVTYITEEGFLKVANCGGVDRRILLAQEVIVFGKSTVKGVVTSTPPHLEKDEKSLPKVDEIFIDIGFSKEQAEQVVSLGDKVIFSNHSTELLNGKITAKAIDDRCGVLAILYALEILKEHKLNCDLSVLFSAQEETGEKGAKIGGYNINPDLAIVVDVSFAKTAGENAEKCGKMSEGVMIGVSPSLNKKLSEEMILIAKENDIPYQIEVMSGLTGTNADEIGVTRGGVKTVTLSIPIKYMHTPIELVDIVDVEATGKLIAKYILKGDLA